MKTVMRASLAILGVALLFSQASLANPTFQVYSPDGTAGDWGPDQDTWLVTESSFDLAVVGTFGPRTATLDEVTLLVSVPQGQTGTITITGADGAVLLTSRTAVADGYYNPNADADTDILTNVGGLDGYAAKTFLPEGTNFNDHYPFQEGVSDFLLYGLDSFDNVGWTNNYNAETGIIGYNTGQGQEKTYSVSVSGFDWVHFDVYGYNVDTAGVTKFASTWQEGTWKISPGSHDTTTYTNGQIPAPGAILLGGTGIVLVGWLKRKRAL